MCGTPSSSSAPRCGETPCRCGIPHKYFLNPCSKDVSASPNVSRRRALSTFSSMVTKSTPWGVRNRPGKNCKKKAMNFISGLGWGSMSRLFFCTRNMVWTISFIESSSGPPISKIFPYVFSERRERRTTWLKSSMYTGWIFSLPEPMMGTKGKTRAKGSDQRRFWISWHFCGATR